MLDKRIVPRLIPTGHASELNDTTSDTPLLECHPHFRQTVNDFSFECESLHTQGPYFAPCTQRRKSSPPATVSTIVFPRGSIIYLSIFPATSEHQSCSSSFSVSILFPVNIKFCLQMFHNQDTGSCCTCNHLCPFGRSYITHLPVTPSPLRHDPCFSFFTASSLCPIGVECGSNVFHIQDTGLCCTRRHLCPFGNLAYHSDRSPVKSRNYRACSPRSSSRYLDITINAKSPGPCLL